MKEKEEELQRQVLPVLHLKQFLRRSHCSNNITIDHIHNACIENSDNNNIGIQNDEEDDDR